MAYPLIIVSTDVDHSSECIKHSAPESYLQAALKYAKVLPLLLPSLGNKIDIDDVLNSVHGVLLTGAESNVCPSLYNSTITEKDGPYDADRDAITLPLIRKAIEKEIPLLAICRGMQELNVALGGTLATEIHENQGIIDHLCEGDIPTNGFLGHSITIESDSHLERILGTLKAMVNSSHRQAIGKLAKDLHIEARAPDNIIEAVWAKNSKAFTLGVQWHPERMVEEEDLSKKIFLSFGEAVYTNFTKKANTKPL